MSTSTISSSSTYQLITTAAEGAMVGAASAKIGIEIYQVTHPNEKINSGKIIAIGGILGGFAGGLASLPLKPEKLAEIQKIAFEILLFEVVVLVVINQVDENQVIEHCITKFNQTKCVSSLTTTAANTATEVGKVTAACATGFNPACAAAVAKATIK
ncbi:MAG TPA: hypothetical protein VGM34_03020 [Chlamydiales bacterium]|jgi:hypothetical protein